MAKEPNKKELQREYNADIFSIRLTARVPELQAASFKMALWHLCKTAGIHDNDFEVAENFYSSFTLHDRRK